MLSKKEHEENQRRHHGEVLANGATDAERVGFRNPHAQRIRFGAVSRIQWPQIWPVSVLDVGAGLGDLRIHMLNSISFHTAGLVNAESALKYTGLDVLPEMTEAAREKHGEKEGIEFRTGVIEEVEDEFDVVIACGLWGEKFHDQQHKEVLDTIRELWKRTKHCLVFTLPSRYADMDDGWRVTFTPEFMMGFCHSQLSERVVIDHSFLPHVFAVQVYKTPSEWRQLGFQARRDNWPPKG